MIGGRALQMPHCVREFNTLVTETHTLCIRNAVVHFAKAFEKSAPFDTLFDLSN